MAEFGSGGGTGGGGLPSSPGPVQGKVAFKAGDGEGGGGGGGRSRFDSAGSRVSNGDCAQPGAGEEPGSVPPASPESSSSKERGFSTSQQREGKPGIPRRSSIIKVRALAPFHRVLVLCDRGREMQAIHWVHRALALDERTGSFFLSLFYLPPVVRGLDFSFVRSGQQ